MAFPLRRNKEKGFDCSKKRVTRASATPIRSSAPASEIYPGVP